MFCNKKNTFKKLGLLLVVLITAMCFTPVAGVNAMGEAVSPAGSAVQFLQQDYAANGINNSDIGVGSYALYVLNRAGTDTGTWLHEGVSLNDAVTSAINGDILIATDPSQKVSAKLLAQDLAAARELGQNDLAEQIIQMLQNKQSSTGFDSNLYSDIPAYDLLGRLGLISEMNIDHAAAYILEAQNTTDGAPDFGSFGAAFDGVFYPDFMTTAQAVRALNCLDATKSDSRIQAAIKDSLDWIQKQQQGDGSFKPSDWDDPVVDTSEVIITLKALEMDPANWKSSEGKTGVDYLMNDALNADGSFGVSGNSMGAAWTLCALNMLGVDPGNEVEETDKNVHLAVVGMDGELLYGPSGVSVEGTNKYGLTVLGALDASGVSCHISSWSYGKYVDSICGQENSGMSGWMYVVNGQIPTVGADQHEINNNDKIIFYYSKSMDQEPPQWDELVSGETQFFLDPDSVTLNTGDKQQLTALWKVDSGTTDVTQLAQWSVADSSIADVDSAGLVTALKAGQTVVDAVYGGQTAFSALTVCSSSGGSNGGGGVGKSINVSLAIVGLNDEILLSPMNVTVDGANEWGFTALGALDASGVSYNTSAWSHGYLIDYIDGLANSGLSGWMYVVNGQTPGSGADQYNIKKNDKIIFYYSSSMEQAPPSWDELKKQTAAGGVGGGQSAKLPAPVEDSVFNNAIRKAEKAEMVVLEADHTQTLLALSGDQLTRILDAGKPLVVTVQEAQFILSADSLKVPELTAKDAAQLQIQVQKLNREDAQSLIEPFAAELKLAGDVYELDAVAVSKDGARKNIGQFPDCRVLLPVPVALREAAAGGKIIACRYNEDSNLWEKIDSVYDIESGTVSFKTEHFSKYALLETVSPPEAPEMKTFKDIAGHWAQAEIEIMATEGYLAGVGDNEFAPENTVTRAEFVTIIVRIAGLNPDPGGAAGFYDVPVDAWYRGSVGAAVNAGLINGMDENSFAPRDQITREQMAAMMARLMAKNGLDVSISDAGAAKLLAGFSDAADVSSWARAPVALMVREQLMTGRENGCFAPLGNTTRAEAAVVLCRMVRDH